MVLIEDHLPQKLFEEEMAFPSCFCGQGVGDLESLQWEEFLLKSRQIDRR